MMSKATRVLIVDDEPDTIEWMALLLENRGYEVKSALNGSAALETCAKWPAEVVLSDLMLPDLDGITLMRELKEADAGRQVIMVTGYGSVSKAVEAMRAGALTFIEKPVDAEVLLAILDKAAEQAAMAAENRRLREDLKQSRGFPNVIARSDKMKQLFELMKMVAPTDASVLIHGENGTGKELIAAAIHEHSKRAAQPFIRINCAAIPSDLIESELFGHRKGSFTGAIADKVGLIEMANGGSLLLDEIGEMPAALQVKLLRVLQEREFRPVGSTRTIRPDFRLICSTNVEINEALESRKIREDLYFRINTVTLAVPPLRDRPDDIPLLAQHFIEKFAARHQRPVTSLNADAERALLRSTWPGNVRELEHVIERAVIVAQGVTITEADLPESLTRSKETATGTFVVPPHHTLADLERSAILQTLERTRWNKRAAANILGVYRPTLYSKLKKYKIAEGPPGKRSAHGGVAASDE
jgi:DNA-binding NtrC family response regulator